MHIDLPGLVHTKGNGRRFMGGLEKATGGRKKRGNNKTPLTCIIEFVLESLMCSCVFPDQEERRRSQAARTFN